MTDISGRKPTDAAVASIPRTSRTTQYAGLRPPEQVTK